MEKEVKIKTTGVKYVKPDKAVLYFSIRNLDIDYETSVRKTTDEYETLVACLSKNGFKPEDFKTSRFEVEERKEGDYDFRARRRENVGEKEQEFYGYECILNLELQIDADSNRIWEILSSIKDSGIHSQISIEYYKADTKEVSRNLLEQMAEEARKEAESLVSGAGGKVGAINSVFYGVTDDSITRVSRNRACSLAKPDLFSNNFVFALYPVDIAIRETAQFNFEIL